MPKNPTGVAAREHEVAARTARIAKHLRERLPPDAEILSPEDLAAEAATYKAGKAAAPTAAELPPAPPGGAPEDDELMRQLLGLSQGSGLPG